MATVYDATVRALSRELTGIHGRLLEVRFVQKNKESILVFSDGTNLATEGGEGGLRLLAFGYSGLGPSCYASFLDEAGFKNTNVVDIEPPVVLRADGTIGAPGVTTELAADLPQREGESNADLRASQGRRAIGVRFDIGKVEAADSKCSYGEMCWRIFWQAVDASWMTGTVLRDGDTAASPDREYVYCLGIAWPCSTAHAEEVRRALENSDAFRAVASSVSFIDEDQLAREPLVDDGWINAEGEFVGSSYRARVAFDAVKKDSRVRKAAHSRTATNRLGDAVRNQTDGECVHCSSCGHLIQPPGTFCPVCGHDERNPGAVGAQLLRQTARAFLVVGILNIVAGIMITGFGWPGGIFSIIVGVVELISASHYWSTPPRRTKPPNAVAILEIVNVFVSLGSLWSVIAGMRNLVRLSRPEVKAYFAGLRDPASVVLCTELPAFADELKKCPKCAERIREDALVCRYCRHEFDETEVAATREQTAQRRAAVMARPLMPHIASPGAGRANGRTQSTGHAAVALATTPAIKPRDWKRLYFSPRGRIGRKTFWFGTLFLVLLNLLAILVSAVLVKLGDNYRTFGSILNLTVFGVCQLLQIPLSVKRIHDRDRSGLFVFVSLVPIVNFWYVVEAYFLRGTTGTNRFGADPLASFSIPATQQPLSPTDQYLTLASGHSRSLSTRSMSKTTQFDKFTGSGLCDVCNAGIKSGEAYMVPVEEFYAADGYRKWLSKMPIIQQTGGAGAFLARARATDHTTHSVVCSTCLPLFGGAPDASLPGGDSASKSKNALASETEGSISRNDMMLERKTSSFESKSRRDTVGDPGKFEPEDVADGPNPSMQNRH